MNTETESFGQQFNRLSPEDQDAVIACERDNGIQAMLVMLALLASGQEPVAH